MTSIKDLEALDYKALDALEAQVRTLKAKLYQQAVAKQVSPLSVLTEMAAKVGLKVAPMPVPTNGHTKAIITAPSKRKGKKVAIKYRDPSNPKNVWSGRGKTPGWVVTYERAGQSRNNFAV